MSEPSALQPLLDAAPDLRRLREYRDRADLAQAVLATTAAVDRSLRLLLRADPRAPDELRLSALSADLSVDRVLNALRERDRISIALAGGVHDLLRTAQRAEQGHVMAADADRVLETVERLRDEAGGALPDLAPPPEDAPGRGIGSGRGERAAGGAPARSGRGASATSPAGERSGAEPAEGTTSPGSTRWRSRRSAGIGVLRRWRKPLLILAALVVAIAFTWIVAVRSSPLEQGVRAFRNDRLGVAERHFAEAVEAEPENVTARLYLARVLRRQERDREAADQLLRAATLEPEDADVRRELGHLFMQLGEHGPAAEQYERAWRADPEEPMNWIGLIRALQAQGDPRADELLRQAPDGVRTALETP